MHSPYCSGHSDRSRSNAHSSPTCAAHSPNAAQYELFPTCFHPPDTPSRPPTRPQEKQLPMSPLPVVFPCRARPQAALLIVLVPEIVQKNRHFSARPSHEFLDGSAIIKQADGSYALPDTCNTPRDGQRVLIRLAVLLMTSPVRRSHSRRYQAAIVRGLQIKMHTITFTELFSAHEHRDGELSVARESRGRQCFQSGAMCDRMTRCSGGG